MKTKLNKRRAGASALIVAALLLFTPVGEEILGSRAVVEASGEGSGCTEQVHFYTEDIDQNFFGPAVEASVDPAVEELNVRWCADPALVVAHAHVMGLSGFAELNGDDQLRAKVRELIDNRDLWLDTIEQLKSLVEADDTNLSIATMSGSYETLYMIARDGEVPLVRKAAPDRPEFQVLRVTLVDGRVFDLKLDCGFQPVAQEFPNIPPMPPVVPPTTPPTTVPPTTTTTTQVCPPDMPHGTWPICKDDPSEDVLLNPDVPDQVKGPGTTPPGGDPGPARPPVDSPTGCNGPCDEDDGFPPTTTTTRPPSTTPPTVPSCGQQGQPSCGNTGVTPPTTIQPPAPPPPNNPPNSGTIPSP